MKKVVFTYEGFKYTNIGDYIQSLAAKQFYPEYGEIIYKHRDELNDVQENCHAIMNGWFTHKPENWPPSSRINPLFVAFHINFSVYDAMLSDESIAYFKKYEPIGCRDEVTAEKLREKNVDAYFSSCLTTTLGYKYHSDKQSDKIFVVDAVHYIPESQRRLQKYKFLFYYLCHFKGVNRFLDSVRSNNNYAVDLTTKNYDRFCRIVRTYMIVNKLLSKEDMNHVEVLTQFHYADEVPSNEERFARAEELLKKYSEARLVITSRIHTALPCTGLETPVIFLQNVDDSKESTCRFKGLLDLLNVVKFRRNKIESSPFALPLSVQDIKNPPKYKSFAERLVEKCKLFTKEKPKYEPLVCKR